MPAVKYKKTVSKTTRFERNKIVETQTAGFLFAQS
jgi:hypothetical protein